MWKDSLDHPILTGRSVRVMGMLVGVFWAAEGLRNPAYGQMGISSLESIPSENSEASIFAHALSHLGVQGRPRLANPGLRQKSSGLIGMRGDVLAEEQMPEAPKQNVLRGSSCEESFLVGGSLKGEVWLVSTREADWETVLEEAVRTIHYWRLESLECWEEEDGDTFFSQMASPMPMMIYIHGNRSDSAEAIQQAWTMYGRVCEAAGERKFRLVIWSWPADRISGRPLSDLRFKAGRSDVEAYLLAWHLRRMPSSEPILLVGYSFGARVITGALHLLGGGRIMGRSLTVSEFRSGGGFRVILAAAAIGNDWILPEGRHHWALSQVEKMLVTVNRMDPALRWYPGLERGDGPALGRTGPGQGGCSGWQIGKIESLPVDCSVGKQHSWRAYLQTPELQARLPVYLFASPKDFHTQTMVTTDLGFVHDILERPSFPSK